MDGTSLEIRRLNEMWSGRPATEKTTRAGAGTDPLRKAVETTPAGCAPPQSFAGALQQAMAANTGVGVRAGAGPLKFSAHALKRLADNRIQLTAGDIQRLQAAVDKAAGKGARSSLILMDRMAFIVSVENRTVITALEEGRARENVFTQIDSAVIT